MTVIDTFNAGTWYPRAGGDPNAAYGAYLYDDNVSYAVFYGSDSVQGQSSDGSQMASAEIAYGDWYNQSWPSDAENFYSQLQQAIQAFEAAQSAVMSTAQTVETAADAVAKVAAAVGLVALLTGIGSVLAPIMAGVDATAIKTEQVAQQIFNQALDLGWIDNQLDYARGHVWILHSTPSDPQAILGQSQQVLEQLLSAWQQILQAVV
jgi:hypothetical protein